MSFVKEGAEFQCNGNANRPCPSKSKPYPYICEDGTLLCCGVTFKSPNRSIRQRAKTMEDVDMPGHGHCVFDETDIAQA